jgi:hypothetical protein
MAQPQIRQLQHYVEQRQAYELAKEVWSERRWADARKHLQHLIDSDASADGENAGAPPAPGA